MLFSLHFCLPPPVDDDMLMRSLENGNDHSVRMCISNVIAPGLGIPPNIFNNNEGRWEGYVHVSSDHITQFAKNIVYQRRKGMKSAVEIACSELKKKHQSLMKEQKEKIQTDIKSTFEDQISKIREQAEMIKVQKEKIKQMELELKKEKETHQKQMQILEELHIADTEECEKEQNVSVTQVSINQYHIILYFILPTNRIYWFSSKPHFSIQINLFDHHSGIRGKYGEITQSRSKFSQGGIEKCPSIPRQSSEYLCGCQL